MQSQRSTNIQIAEKKTQIMIANSQVFDPSTTALDMLNQFATKARAVVSKEIFLTLPRDDRTIYTEETILRRYFMIQSGPLGPLPRIVLPMIASYLGYPTILEGCTTLRETLKLSQSTTSLRAALAIHRSSNKRGKHRSALGFCVRMLLVYVK